MRFKYRPTRCILNAHASCDVTKSIGLMEKQDVLGHGQKQTSLAAAWSRI